MSEGAKQRMNDADLHSSSFIPDPSESSVLASVRRAIGRHDRVTPLQPFAKPSSGATRDQIVARFIEEAVAVRAQVFRAQSPEAAVARIAEICKQSGVQEVAHSGAALLSELGLLASLADEGLMIVEAAGFGEERRDDLISRLASCGVGVTAADYAIAETGTIALSSDEQQSLLVSLLPPVHIAVLRESQIEATLDAVLDKLAADRMRRAEPCRSANFITGPSRTGDVELTLSIGVHGPKELHLIILQCS